MQWPARDPRAVRVRALSGCECPGGSSKALWLFPRPSSGRTPLDFGSHDSGGLGKPDQSEWQAAETSQQNNSANVGDVSKHMMLHPKNAFLAVQHVSWTN